MTYLFHCDCHRLTLDTELKTHNILQW